MCHGIGSGGVEGDKENPGRAQARPQILVCTCVYIYIYIYIYILESADALARVLASPSQTKPNPSKDPPIIAPPIALSDRYSPPKAHEPDEPLALAPQIHHRTSDNVQGCTQAQGVPFCGSAVR